MLKLYKALESNQIKIVWSIKVGKAKCTENIQLQVVCSTYQSKGLSNMIFTSIEGTDSNAFFACLHLKMRTKKLLLNLPT